MSAGNRWVGLLCWPQSVGGWEVLFISSFFPQEQYAILMDHVNQCNVPENQNVDKCSLSVGGTKEDAGMNG